MATTYLIEWSGVANFYTPTPLRNFFNWLRLQSDSEILQQHSAPKYSKTKIRFDEKFKPIFMLLNSLV